MSEYVKSNAFVGLGLVLEIGTIVSPEEYTQVGEVKSFDGPDLKSETTETTNVQSPGGVKEFLSTLTDPGECSLAVNYVPNDPGQQAVYDALIAKVRYPFRVTLPPTSVETGGDQPGVWDFLALVTGFAIKIPLDKEATVDIKLKISGLPVFTTETA